MCRSRRTQRRCDAAGAPARDYLSRFALSFLSLRSLARAFFAILTHLLSLPIEGRISRFSAWVPGPTSRRMRAILRRATACSAVRPLRDSWGPVVV